MQQKELAKLLGISPAMVSRLAKRSMPTDSLERAERWRRRHLEPARVKGARFDPTQPVVVSPVKPLLVAPAAPAVSLENVELAAIGLDVRLSENDADRAKLMVQQFRQLLRKLSPDSEPCLSLRVWLALIEWLLNPDSPVFHSTDQAALLTPGEFGARWPLPTSGKNALFDACDWNDISIHGWPVDDEEQDAT